MATTLIHRRIHIVTLDAGEQPAHCCAPGDIAICPDSEGWWTHFIASDGSIDSYDRPYRSYLEALWAAKAAAEFGF